MYCTLISVTPLTTHSTTLAVTMSLYLRLMALYGLIASVPTVSAGFDAGASNNIDIYWGMYDYSYHFARESS